MPCEWCPQIYSSIETERLALATFSSLTVTASQQNRLPISTEPTITTQLHSCMHILVFGAHLGESGHFCLCSYCLSMCEFFCFSIQSWKLTRWCLGYREAGMGTKLATWCTLNMAHTELILLFFWYLIISCSKNKTWKWEAIERRTSRVQSTCKKICLESQLVLRQHCSATSYNWWLINNMFH